MKTVAVFTKNESFAGTIRTILHPAHYITVYSEYENIAYKVKEARASKVIIDITGENPAELEEEIFTITEDPLLIGLHVIFVASDEKMQQVLTYTGAGGEHFKGKTGETLRLFEKFKNKLSVTKDKYKRLFCSPL